jgi:hypothetical protein
MDIIERLRTEHWITFTENVQLKSEAAAEIELLRKALTLVVTYQEGFTLTIEEVVAAAREALKEKE